MIQTFNIKIEILNYINPLSSKNYFELDTFATLKQGV